MKVCKVCRIEKRHDDFYKWQRKCKACVLAERKLARGRAETSLDADIVPNWSLEKGAD